jgi:clostripain
MARVGSNEYVNVISLIDRERGPAQINYIEKGNIKKIKDMGEMDMGDYKELVKFAKFIKENYPAKHYMIGIWNHGSGWKAKQDASNVVRGISYDDSSSNHITNDQLAIATKEIAQVLGQKIDVINMDACLMGMSEVAYAIKDNCNYFVGSEETEAGKGTPYDDVLKGLKPGMSPRDFANHWVNAYAESYNGGSQGRDDSTQSAYDLSKTDAFLDALNGFAKAIMAGKYSDKVMAAAGKTVKFAYPQNIDLLHFLKNLRPEVQGDTALNTAMDKLEKAAKAMIINNKTTGRYYNKYENAEGIAVYLPSNLMIESKYLTLDYSKNVLWDDMLMALREQRDVQKTVDGVCKGDFKGLKSAISEAKKNPRSKYARALLRELNYAAYTEKKIQAKDKDEFERLFKELKGAMQSK